MASNALWSRTLIGTSALNVASPALGERARTPEIMAEAAYWILTQPSRTVSGRCFLDEQVLRDIGLTDFDRYLIKPGLNRSSFISSKPEQ